MICLSDELLLRIFFIRGERAFLQGVLQKSGCRTWFFDGNCVVKCVVNVVIFMVISRRRKTCHVL